MMSCSQSRKLAPLELAGVAVYRFGFGGPIAVWAFLTLDISVPINSALSIPPPTPPPPRPPCPTLLHHCYPFRPSSFGQLCYQVMLPAPPVEFIERRRTIIICTCLALRQEVVELASFVGPLPKVDPCCRNFAQHSGHCNPRVTTANGLFSRKPQLFHYVPTLSLRRPARLALKLPVLTYSAIIELALTGN